MSSDWLPNVWLIDNGEYWQARWKDRRGQRQAKSIGAKSKVSKREATRRCRNLALKLATGEISGHGKAPGLADFLVQYLRLRPELSKATVAQVNTTGEYLKAHFGDSHRIDRISREDAAEWIAALASGHLSEARKIQLKARAVRSMRAATIAKHAATAKAIFGFAVDELELITRNPFAKLRTRATPPPKLWREISRQDLEKIIDACPNDGWRALFALCRLTGVRRGEALRLEWVDLDFAANKMQVNARIEKTTTKQAHRVCPIEPPRLPAGLAAKLLAYKAASNSARVCEGVDTHNFAIAVAKILKRSVGEYAKPFHTLRKCFENEVVMVYPAHIIEEWFGHSEEVAKRHYLRGNEELFVRTDAAGGVQTGVQASVELST